MENLEEDVYAKKYLVNYRYISSEGKCASFSQDLNVSTRTRLEMSTKIRVLLTGRKKISLQAPIKLTSLVVQSIS